MPLLFSARREASHGGSRCDGLRTCSDRSSSRQGAQSSFRNLLADPRRLRSPSAPREYLRSVDEAEASGHVRRREVRRRATAEQDRDALAGLVEYDADPFEMELYELAADPQTLLIDRARRHGAGQYERRVRGLRKRRRRDERCDGGQPRRFTDARGAFGPMSRRRADRPTHRLGSVRGSPARRARHRRRTRTPVWAPEEIPKPAAAAQPGCLPACPQDEGPRSHSPKHSPGRTTWHRTHHTPGQAAPDT